MKKPKVLVAMSGGVDSSIAALLMKKKGYEVIGAFMKNWSSQGKGIGECNWKDERRHAIQIAKILKIPLITLDFEKEYRKDVIDKMFKYYKKGITPNPDVDCNQKVKFPLLIKAAKKLGAEFVVTGHYARIQKIVVNNNGNKVNFRVGDKNKREYNKNLNSVSMISGSLEGGRLGDGMRDESCEMLRAKDESKDQSYFLYRIKQSELRYLLFPIGDYTKKEVREIAKENNFPNFDKKSTVGICFVGKVNLKEFLQKRIKSKEGKILDPQGNIIGKHDGIYYYTIGQRIGMRFGMDISKNSDKNVKIRRWYVAGKDAKKNILIAAPEGHKLLYRKEFHLKNPHWISNDVIKMVNVFRKDVAVNNKGSKVNFRVSDKGNGRYNKNLNVESFLRVNTREGGRRGDGMRDRRMKVLARIRQLGDLVPAVLLYKDKKFRVILNKQITGVSEGQAAVLYAGKKVLGGGEIMF